MGLVSFLAKKNMFYKIKIGFKNLSNLKYFSFDSVLDDNRSIQNIQKFSFKIKLTLNILRRQQLVGCPISATFEGQSKAASSNSQRQPQLVVVSKEQAIAALNMNTGKIG